MSGSALVVAAGAVALGAAVWAGLFALAEQAAAEDAAESLSQAGPGAGGKRLELHRALHVGRLALLVVSGVAAAEAMGWWRRPWSSGVLVLAVAVLLVFALAEALPRAVAAVAPELARGVVGTARGLVAPFAPLLWLTHGVERRLQLLRGPGGEAGPRVGAAQRDMLLGIFALGDTTVAEVMIPRLDIAAVEVQDSTTEVLEAFLQSEHARLPVADGTLDTIVGVIYAKDLLATLGPGRTERPWQELIRPPTFVPEAKTLDAQLRDFQAGPSHLAIVVDEYGGTAGLVTREDVLEEIVGEIRDEYDVEEPPAIQREGDDRFWVDGAVSLDALTQATGLRIERGDVSTVGGLVLSVLGRVPRPGEEFTLDAFRVVVEQVVRRRVKRVYFERLVVPAPLEEQPAGEGRC